MTTSGKYEHFPVHISICNALNAQVFFENYSGNGIAPVDDRARVDYPSTKVVEYSSTRAGKEATGIYKCVFNCV